MEIEFIDSKDSKSKSDDIPRGSYIDGLINRDIWDEVVPIVSSEDEVNHSVYINDEIGDPGNYSKLIQFLSMLDVDDTVKFHINSPGGIIDSGFMIIDAIDKCKAHTIAVLTGSVASAATVITLACDEIEVADYTSFMIHAASGGYGGKMHETKAYVEFSNRELTNALTSIYKGFLTDEEILQVLDGKDIWLNKAEVLERWENKNA